MGIENLVVAVFAPPAVVGGAGAGDVVETPFGPAGPARVEREGGRTVIWIARGGDPRARVVAAKERGAVHAIGLGEGIALRAGLRPGEWLAPDDAIDQTRGTPTTFFTGSGLGYLPQSPPFCRETREAVAAVCEHKTGIAVAAPERAITPAEVKAWGILGGDAAMPGLGPEWYLCREMEIGYAPLVKVCWAAGEARRIAEAAARLMIERAVAALPEAHSWAGSNAAARRELGEDWRRWIQSDSSEYTDGTDSTG